MYIIFLPLQSHGLKLTLKKATKPKKPPPTDTEEPLKVIFLLCVLALDT